MTAANLQDPRQVQLDRMRYTKNLFSSRMAYVAILFNVLYFVSIYESDVGSWYYRYVIGISIVYNLVFMLMTFLASEGVKNYKMGYAVLMLVMGAIQIARIFILPMDAFTTLRPNTEITVMESPQFIYVTVCLCLSAAASIAGGVVGVIQSSRLAAYNKRTAPKADQPCAGAAEQTV